MAEIHVLDKHTAELIAAGEVVERPASVVKELLENSIDAGASQITVSIESGGVRLIEISDNGTGIEAKYIPTAFIRHATSKIRTEDDLTSIHTLGFRGEALASIASVARVEVLTRTEADECASLYRIEGGEEQPIEPGARGVGTTIRVCDLFFNTPARMKFLKKDSSEGTFVADIVGHVALSHPEVSFKFIREGKLQYVTPGDGQLRSAAYAVLGREFSRDLVEVDNREGVYRVWGLITQPRSCRASRSMQYFYINGRYVRNRTMMAGMEMAFKGTTMQGKFPGGILLLEMPADLVDVNVHPAKTEVRFARENDIFDLVYHAVKLALSQPGTGERQFVFDSEKENDVSNECENSGDKEKNAVKNNNFTGLSAVISGQAEPGSLPHPEEKPLRPAAPAASVTPRPTQPSAPERDILPLPVKAPEKAAPASEHTWTTVAASEPLPMNAALHSPEPPQEESVLEPPPFRAASSESQLDIEADIDLPDVTRDHMAAWEPAPDEPERLPLPEASDEPQQSAAPEQLGFDVQDGPEPLRYVGEIFRTYILAERGDEICIIDKHAAHERQLFEKLAAHYGDVPSQLLLEPLVVELSAEEKTALLTNLDLLESAGLEVSDFGGSSVCLRSVPADVEQGSAEDLLVELAAKLAHGSRDALNERTEWVLHSISCRAAIKAGDHTSSAPMGAPASSNSPERSWKSSLAESCNKKHPVLAVVGPTATGKTALGVALAEAFEGEVISADSMQIYKGLDVGTAKVAPEETHGIPHHAVDILEPDEPFSVADFVALAGTLEADISARGRLPILVGGTGLYVQSFLYGVRFAAEKTPDGLREQLAAEMAEKGPEAMYKELQTADPEAAAAIHPNNFRATGKRLSEQKAQSLPPERPYRSLVLGLDFPDRAQLYHRIDRRVDKMLDASLLDEAKLVYDHRQTYRTAAQAIGYKEFFPYFEGTAPLDACTEKLKQASRNYAKRQVTWFRHMDGVVWLDASAPDVTARAVQLTREFLAKG